MERDANVISFPQTETINGVRMHLGRMSCDELIDLRDECSNRVEDAKTDLQIVQYTLDRRFPDGGGDAS